MRPTTAVVVAALLLSLAGCSGGIGPGTETVTGTDAPTPSATVAGTDGPEPNETPAGTDTPAPNATAVRGGDNLTAATLDRMELRFERTVMGYPSTTVRGNVSAGAARTTIRRDFGDNRTTHEVALPENWSRRLVRNLGDNRSTDPGNVTVVSDYEERFTATLYFGNRTVVITTSRVSGPESLTISGSDEPTYYSRDPELELVVAQLYTRLSSLEDT